MIRIALTAVAGLALCATAVPQACAAPSAAVFAPADPADPAGPADPTAHANPAPAAGDLLYVTSDDGHGVVGKRVLRCHPVEGSLTETVDAAEACRRLDELGGPVGPVPKGEMCSMIWGGPQTARITGTWRGRPVDESYSRGNGCQTARWQRMLPVLPGAATGGSPR